MRKTRVIEPILEYNYKNCIPSFLIRGSHTPESCKSKIPNTSTPFYNSKSANQILIINNENAL